MNKYTFIILVLLISVLSFQQCRNSKENEFGNMVSEGRILIDSDWQFSRGKFSHINDFDKRMVDLPHDWSIEDRPGTDSPFDPDAIGAISTGYTIGGTACYQKELSFPRKLKDKEISVDFEGIYMNADIYFNGEHLYNHPYGYTEFSVDLTDKIDFGKPNILVVEVKNEGRNSRWYSGSGIYRHVWLNIDNPVHLKKWGTGITTPQVSTSAASVVIENTVENKSSQPEEIVIINKIIDEKGQTIAESQSGKQLNTSSSEIFKTTFKVSNPELWSPGSPTLYKLVTELRDSDSELLDQSETNFGIRSIEFNVEDGFLLNGKPTLLKGGCMHHDNGPLGAAAYDRAEERRVELMKASGFNAIRCAHNPPSTAFLDACDRIGILVIDEAFDMWNKEKRPQDYHLYFEEWWEKDIEAMVLRDRNHPSVIMWSTGNEIPERQETLGVETSKKLAQYVKELDPTRPVTSAVNNPAPNKDPYFATLDLAGYNYSYGGERPDGKSIFETDHARVPDRISYCSESFPLESFGAWMDVLDHSWVIGDFVWTGFDYLGEASIGWNGYPHDTTFYPWNHAHCGDIDICGFKRPQSYYRDVLFQHEEGVPVSVFVKPPDPSFKLLHERTDWSKWHWHDLVSDWNWKGYEGEEFEVTVFSMYPEVELFLNGKSVGKKQTTRETEWEAVFSVPYEPGELKAIGYDGQEKKSTYALQTADNTSQIVLTPDRQILKANGQDLCYITVEMQDEDGNVHPKNNDLIQFELEGPGEIIAVGSSNPKSLESFQQPQRKAYKGRCLVIVKSGIEKGNIQLKAKTDELSSNLLTIKTINE